MVTRLWASDGVLYAWVFPADAPFRVRLETGVSLFVDALAALRQRARERLGAPATPDPPSRVSGGRQRATSRRGGAR